MDKVWEIKDPEEYLKPRKKTHATPPPRIQKDPARAYTLSLLFWGAGQSYNEEHGKSLAFEILLIALIVTAVIAAIFHDRLILFLRSGSFAPSEILLFCQAMLLGLLVLWLSIAGDAYRAAAKSRYARFTGIPSRVYPCLCSLLVPGWGQFLNGQPLKGSFFSAIAALGFFAVFAVPLTLLTWPLLEASDNRFVVEQVFTVTVLYSPLIPFLWVLSSYDALKVSLDELKKESLWERIKATNNRRRTQGWISGVFPQVRLTLALILALAVLAFLLTRAFPAGFYTGLLRAASSELSRMGMVILPDIVDHVIAAIARLRNS